MATLAPHSFLAVTVAAGATRGFRAYSALHGVIVLVFLATFLSLSLLRRRLGRRGRGAGERMDRWLGITALLVWLAYKTFAWLPGQWRPESSLPLQVCDVNGLVAALALLTGRRPLRAVLYFWGIGLSTTAFYYPDLSHGPDTVKFWLFWLTHYAIVGSAVYEVLGRGFWPGWRDYFTAVAAAVLYLFVVIPVDALTGFDYGYVGRTAPGQMPLLDALGKWPWRLGVMSLLTLAVFALLLLPFKLIRRREDDTVTRACPEPVEG